MGTKDLFVTVSFIVISIVLVHSQPRLVFGLPCTTLTLGSDTGSSYWNDSSRWDKDVTPHVATHVVMKDVSNIIIAEDVSILSLYTENSLITILPGVEIVFAADGTSCGTCDAGTIFKDSFCVLCTAGRFSNTMGSLTCTLCPDGKFNPIANGTSCTDCGVGTKSLVGADECIPDSSGDDPNQELAVEVNIQLNIPISEFVGAFSVESLKSEFALELATSLSVSPKRISVVSVKESADQTGSVVLIRILPVTEDNAPTPHAVYEDLVVLIDNFDNSELSKGKWSKNINTEIQIVQITIVVELCPDGSYQEQCEIADDDNKYLYIGIGAGAGAVGLLLLIIARQRRKSKRKNQVLPANTKTEGIGAMYA